MWLKVWSALLVLVVVSAGPPSNRANKVEKPNWQPRFLGQVPLEHAAFMELYFSEDTTMAYEDRWTLYISTFSPAGDEDPVFRMRSPGRFLDDITSWNIELMDQSSFWPNNPDYIPSSVGGNEGVIWTSGFLIPGKTRGKLQMYDTTKEPVDGPYNIASNDDTTWSYHHVIWKDIDVDGDLDALTARFHKPIFGITKQELVWFENEGTGYSEGWKQHTIANGGPDVSLALVTLSAGGRDYDCIVAGELLNERVSIYWTESESNDWSDPTLVKSRVINEDGQGFDVLIEDLNGDGVLEILSSEFRTDLNLGHLTVYQFPEDFRTDNFSITKIAENFLPNDMVGGQTMSPGSMRVFYPNVEYAQDLAEDGMPHKPFIVLSGDDDGRAYILYPTTDDRKDWTYEMHVLVDTEDTTVGKMACADLNGDGYNEIIVPGYTVGQVYVFTYAP